MVEVALGRYSPTLLAVWGPSNGYDAVEVSSSMPDHPNVWTNGSLVLDRFTGISASGAGFFAHSSEECWNGSRWGHVDRVHLEGQVHSCRGFCSVLWFLTVCLGKSTGGVTTLLTRLLTLVVGGLVMLSLMLFIPVILDLHRFFIAITRSRLVCWCSSQEGSSWSGFFCLGQVVFGIRNGLLFLHLLSVLRTLLLGLIPLVSGLSGSLS